MAETTHDDAAPTARNLPPYWLVWLSGFLGAFPLLLTAPLITFVLTGRQFPPDVWGFLYFSLFMAMLPYLQQAFDRDKVQKQWEQSRAQFARWGEPARLYRLLTRLCFVVGGLAFLAHVITKRVTGTQVALVTLGLPLYYFLFARLLVTLNRFTTRLH